MRIQRLPDDLVNKIAAGEVVERPASVVKELVENAIDAAASIVQVDVEGGGKSLIRVRDDGSGMSAEDARMALERHATSKLRRLEDLQAVATHGFRGEALPSIGSVSHLVVKTRPAASSAGTEIAVRHGRLEHVREAGHPQGTTVEVRDLFGGVPARRKFLRAESTEAGHVAEALTLLALARPGLSLFLRSSGRRVIDAPAVVSLAPRLHQLYGPRFVEGLVEVAGGQEWAQVSGFVSRADSPRPPRPNVRLFVNHRPVRDRAVAKAVVEAYRAAGTAGRGFEAFLFLDVPPSMVDVNVHPAKSEVRFADSRVVFTAVERSVRQALSSGARQAPRADTRRVEAAVQGSLEGPASSREARPAVWAAPAAAGPSGLAAEEASRSWDGATLAAEGGPVSVPVVLGQHRHVYIVTTDGEELILIDQHTAHERVRFEGIVDGLDRGQPESQLLLAPVVVPLSPDVAAMLHEQLEWLLALGYDVEPFGGGSARLRAVPAAFGARDQGAALEHVLRDVRERGDTGFIVAGRRDRLAATLACHSAVRAGQALTRETMTAIVGDLFETRHPTLCPHGRPTMVRLPREELSRWFGRKGWTRQ